MPLDVMVDLETMGIRVDAAFVSIGAVAFDPFHSPGPASDALKFYRNVDLQSCIDLGLRIDGGTVMWWMTKDDEARRALVDPKPVPVVDALRDFVIWYKRVTEHRSCVWSHGATFDIPIISEACLRAGLISPWTFWMCNDTRTVFRLADWKLPNADTRGGGHNSLNDAVAQAAHLQRCIAKLRLAASVAMAREEADPEEVQI